MTWLPIVAGIAIFVLFAMLVMLALSHPMDLRETRWTKIKFTWLCAGVMLCLGTMVGLDWIPLDNFIVRYIVIVLFAACVTGILACWIPNVAWLFSRPVDTLIFGGVGTQSAGHIPEYKYAREKALEGDFKEAIKMCQWELSKQPDNYEGLLLLATIHMEMKNPKLALAQVELILKIPHLSENQEREALHAKAECLNAIH
ncbi:MAG: hypothetical protein HZA89_15090 [Verrucomicrobia bacterium]|nr:hypothetical protein [Verrucomicrobiota bacterium]